MSARRLQIPTGMQDTLPGECCARRELEQKLRSLFRLAGYREIGTPILEYYDALDDATYGYRPEHVWKTFDASGRVLAVRPDSTIPAARLAAGTLRDDPLPLRLCYLQSATVYDLDTASLLCEQPQAGVELMGEGGVMADAEVIALAVDCLRSAGLKRFQIELGEASFFEGFMREAGLSREVIREVRQYVERKDSLGMELCLSRYQISRQVSERLMRLPRLWGDESVLEEAASLTCDPECLAALENLRGVIRLLRSWGIEEPVAIDLGMAQEAGYYSGIIFRGHAEGVGQPILSGGRYDGLTARFGRELPAVGFALMLKLLMIALEKQGERFTSPTPDWLIAYEPGCEEAALAEARRRRSAGESAVLLYGSAKEELGRRLKEGQGRGALYVGRDGTGILREVD